MEKINLTKIWKSYYKATSKPSILEITPLNAMTILGEGDPNPDDSAFMQSLMTVYPIAYAIKRVMQREGLDFVVPKMEGQWWVPEGKVFEETPMSEWQWKIIIPLPDFVKEAHFLQAVAFVRQQKELPLLDKVQYERMHEGTCAQILHIGGYQDEKPTLDTLYAFVNEQGYELSGHHHEIYISDPRKTVEERLKTIIRYPIKKSMVMV